MSRIGERLDEFAATLPPGEQAALRSLLRRAAPKPAEEVLAAEELAVCERLRAEPDPAPGGQAALTVIMKATRLCNLRCTYCHSWRSGPNQKMTFDVLAHAIHGALRDPSVGYVDFVWHGGEVTVLPVEFYRKALWLQERFRRPGQTVLNTVQTNATRLSDEWLAFLRDQDIGVGISLDGPPEVHDARRVDAAGRPTSARVREGIERIRAAGITRWGVLMVVDGDVCALGPRRLLEYLTEIGVERVSLLNVLPENTPAGTPLQGDYLSFPRYVDFLRGLFALWWNEYRDRIVVSDLADLSGQVGGAPAQLCIFAGGCFGLYLTIEPTGEVSACDKYIDDGDYRFGHVLDSGLAGVQRSNRLVAIREDNARAVERMRDCRWFGVCHGGCPHDHYTSERRLPRYDGRCCGLAPLLDDIAATVNRDGVEPTIVLQA